MDQVIRLSEMVRTVVQEPLVLAAGLWRCGSGQLIQEFFVARDALPVPVAREFAQATRMVPLSRTDLGIVSATVNQRIVLVQHTMTGTALNGSAGWLQRFGAKSSCSIPVFMEGRASLPAVGWIVAIATGEELAKDSVTVQRWAGTTQRSV